MYDRVKDNAKRLANTLNSYSEDITVIKALAHYLNYEPRQLAEDMKDVKCYIKQLEEDSN